MRIGVFKFDGKEYEKYKTLLWNKDGDYQCPKCANVDKQHNDVLFVQYDIEPEYDRATYAVSCNSCEHTYAFDLYRKDEKRAIANS
jgi:uncharacterized Zn finger protein (UPF0148 family)